MQEARPRSLHAAEAFPRRNVIRRILGLAREQVGMDAAFLAEFSDGNEIVHSADGDAASFEFYPGAQILFQDGYSRRAFDGDFPGLIRDARSDSRCQDLVLTDEGTVGAYVGAPVHLPDGRVWGTVFCLSHHTQPQLDDRDVRFLEALARLVGDELVRRERVGEEQSRKLRRIRRLIDRGVGIAYQPIYDLQSESVVGVEALARFAHDPPRSPDRWFAEAAEVGLGVDLEVAAATAAIQALEQLPESQYLAVNVSPQAVMSSRFLELVSQSAAERLVVELTEHVQVENYVLLNAALASLRGRGVRIAVDDLGAGFASLRHVLRLRPDIIKLDITLTRDIDVDPVRRALATSFITFADDIDAAIIAEGIETAGEMKALQMLGVECGQGFYLARPGPLEQVSMPPRKQAG